MNSPLSEAINLYLSRVREALGRLKIEEIEKVIYRLKEARQKRQRVFICGNGGSATTSIALADALKWGSKSLSEPIIKASSLCENIATLTRYANEFSYEEIFVRAMSGDIEKDDVLIAISGSGMSKNILKVAQAARSIEATIISFTGFDGGKLRDLSDLSIVVPSHSIRQIEDIHFILGQLIATCLVAIPHTPLSKMISSYLEEVSGSVEKMPIDLIGKVIYRLEEARLKGQKVLTCGNGRSAITSIHFAADLMKGAMAAGKPIIEAFSLCSNIAHLTAYANDISFEDAFSKVMDGQIKRGNVLVALDENGDSTNIFNAIKAARVAEATTIAFTGFDGKLLKDVADICLIVPARFPDQVQSIHFVLCHLITDCLANMPAEV